MSWRDLMPGAEPLSPISPEPPKPPAAVDCGDCGDCGYRQADTESAPRLADLEAAAGPDWPAIRENPDALAALRRAMEARRLREQGIPPDDYTQPAHCDGCGPVLLWEGAPARVITCPWCWNRRAGKPVPKPTTEQRDFWERPKTRTDKTDKTPSPVTCATCGHFEPNTVGSGAGVGRCRIKAPASLKAPALWPHAAHRCPDWSPADER